MIYNDMNILKQSSGQEIVEDFAIILERLENRLSVETGP